MDSDLSIDWQNLDSVGVLPLKAACQKLHIKVDGTLKRDYIAALMANPRALALGASTQGIQTSGSTCPSPAQGEPVQSGERHRVHWADGIDSSDTIVRPTKRRTPRPSPRPRVKSPSLGPRVGRTVLGIDPLAIFDILFTIILIVIIIFMIL
jgi:hypothetical protein